MATTKEFGGDGDEARSSTFSLTEEDHTLANSLRFVLNKDPRVSFCGYSVPHPSENRVNIRVQTTGSPARDVLKDALQDLMALSDHVRITFEKAVDEHKASQSMREMSVGTSAKSGVTQKTASSMRSE
jgi:DNA-directed RNA polymerase I and III subunit RPAC2